MSKRTNDTPAEWYKQTENEYINKRYIMFGLGSGEYVAEVLNNCKTEFKVIVYEPAASGVGQSDEDYAGLKGLSGAGVEIYVEGREQENFTNFLYKFIDYSTLQAAVIFKHPMYESLGSEIEFFDTCINAATSGILASRSVKTTVCFSLNLRSLRQSARVKYCSPNCAAAFFTPISSESFNASSLNSLLYFAITNTFLSTIIISAFWVFVDCTYIIPLHTDTKIWYLVVALRAAGVMK